ncbi:MAG: hypothetical protein H6739_30995 [Alphaproteobacteria bacterium]|nr:hypothetical protein [Alphaproteobacteria bacterium]
MLRSVGAVLGGYATMVVGVLAMTLVLYAVYGEALLEAGPEMEGYTGLLIGEIAAGFAFAIGGGWVTARLSRSRPWAHIGGLIGLMLALGLLTFLGEQGMKPAWSILGTILSGPLGVLLGGGLRVRQLAA